jgi:hypothetical protein
VDIKPPTCVGPGLYVPKEEILCVSSLSRLLTRLGLDKIANLDHEWKNTFFIRCLTPMLEAMVSIQPIEYAHILDLDKSVRDFEIPSLLDDHQPNDINPRFLVMQRSLVTMGREIGR